MENHGPVSGERDVVHKKYVDELVAAKASKSASFFDATITKTGTTFVVTVDGLPDPVPLLVSLRGIVDGDYAAGDTMTINGTAVSLFSNTVDALPANAWKAGAAIELLWETGTERAFFKRGVGAGGGIGGSGVKLWNIFPGLTPSDVSEPGLYVPDATRPTLTYVNGDLRLAGVKVVQVACGGFHSIFILENGEAWSCGRNDYGQLGRAVEWGSATSVNLGKIPTLSGVKSAACGRYYSIFILENGEAWNCGRNDYGQLGRAVANGSTTSVNLAKIPTLSAVRSAAGEEIHSIFILENGEAWSCGYNDSGQLGRAVANGSATSVNLAKIPTLSGVKSAACGNSYSIFILENGEAWSCGRNDSGQLGRAVAKGSTTWVNLGKIPTLSGVKSAACGQYYSIFILENGEAWSCGYNEFGQLGRDVAKGSTTSVNLGKIPTLSGVKSAACGNTYSIFILENGEAWSCGRNDYGQLGRAVEWGSATSVNLGKIPTLSGVKSAAGGQYYSIFILENGEAWSCGYNEFGQLGRAVANASTTSVNLGTYPEGAFGTGGTSIHPEGALLVKTGSDGILMGFIYQSDTMVGQFRESVERVYQVRGGVEVELAYTVHEAG